MSPPTWVVNEFGRLYREELGARAWNQLRRLDEERLRRRLPPVFDWSYRAYARARNLVGLVQTADCTIEILPKTSPSAADELAPHAASNLIYMLAHSYGVSMHLVGGAGVLPRRARLLDAFIRPFAASLLDELLKGVHRDYSRLEDELPVVRGQILLHRQMRRPPWAQQRVSVRFDEYDESNLVNRVLKAATAKMIGIVRDPTTRALLSRASDELGNVSDHPPEHDEMRRMRFDRFNSRFRPLYEFARRVLGGDAPTTRAGELPSFSIVFPMDKLFERFFAASLLRYADRIGLKRNWIHPQARGHKKWMLWNEAEERGVLRLKPDVILDREGSEAWMVLDTKWKRLAPGSRDGLDGVSESDVYQIASYGTRYGCEQAVLVFPRVHGASERLFSVLESTLQVRIGMLDLSGDLATERTKLVDDLRRLVFGRD